MNYIEIDGHRIEVISKNTIIVGAGAAALNTADRLYEYGVRDIAIVCEDMAQSTSRNTGSDKQTYYKLSLAGDEGDSVRELANTLMSGGCVDGDIALAEAANSAACFLRLCELGVPFPINRYGEYIGYKTDHDPRRRATSAGPLTSRLMTECLEEDVRKKGIPVYSGMQAISILTADNSAFGLLCLNLKAADKQGLFTAFNCENIIYATGGPAGMYADSVYPEGQYGASGIAFKAGVTGKNLTEWQYGLASLTPRWNVSGTYMQALPRFISTDSMGGDEREFLSDYLSKSDMLDNVFLKGYEWPFDARKATNGSSIIDILVYNERCIKNRRVYIDYRSNPSGGELDVSALNQEARQYLEKAGALFGKPIDRLMHMNAPAYELYLKKGVDLKKQPLEIALCVQHNNGGLAIDCWWQTNITGLFAAGEVSCSHGVYRPGGSALNAGQVGSMRAAQYIAAKRSHSVRSDESFTETVRQQIAGILSVYQSAMSKESNIDAMMDNARRNMSDTGAAIRNYDNIAQLAEETKILLSSFNKCVSINSYSSISKLYRFYDMLISQYVYLSAMKDYIENGGKSRGSAIYYDASGTKPLKSLDERFRFAPDEGNRNGLVQEVSYKDTGCVFEWRNTRPIPEDDDFFENVWRAYREHKNVY